eukprot:5326245-Pleurochrysis_carterae.AAC.1
MNFLLAKVIGTHCSTNATAVNAATANPSSRPPTHSTPPPATGAPTRSTVTKWEAPAPPDAPASDSAVAVP